MKFPLGRPSLPETNIFAPENGWLEDWFVCWNPAKPGRCELLVSFREGLDGNDTQRER